MATASEIQSLEEISYKSRSKLTTLGTIILGISLFVFAFLNFFPVSSFLRGFLTPYFRNAGCDAQFERIGLGFFMPRIIISDVTIPSTCFGQMAGESLRLSHLTINYHLINFSPLGLPFRIDTELNGQPISLYYVLGFGQQMVRLKDQNIVLSRLQDLSPQFKLAGSVTVDLNLLMEGQQLKSLNLKAASKNLEIPSQDLQGFILPVLKINDFFVEAVSENPPRINVTKLIVGNPNSPVRANFKGKIDLLEGAAPLSPLDLTGEVAFSQSLRESIPLVEMVFSSFAQKDGFYQIRLGGTLGAPKPISP